MSSEPQHPSTSHYEPLSAAREEIRVLDIEPSAADDDLVHCAMRTISLLDERVKTYETISYCWGLPTSPSYIRLNGSLVPVPASSEAAIRRMRLSREPRTLWIDAICINQSSLTERSQQVSIMSTVYRKGKQNLVYLGEDTEGLAKRGVKGVHDLVSEMKKATKDLESFIGILNNPLNGVPIFSKEGFSFKVDFEALECLFGLQWFRRLWVLQEVVLAPSSICFWGAIQVNLLDTVRAARWLSHKFRFISQGIYDCTGWRCATEMFDFLHAECGFLSEKRTLTSILQIPERFEETNPKDSIYAVLGLVDSSEASNDKHLATLLQVDYSRSLAEVLRDATRYALCENGDLRVLRRVNHRSDTLEERPIFPTWAIRADVQRELEDITVVPVVSHAFDGLDSPSLLAEASFGAEVLLVEGFIADQVFETTVTCDGGEWYEYEGYNSWLLSAKRAAQRRPKVETSEDMNTDHTAMALTLVAGESYNRQRARPEDVSVLAQYMEDLDLRRDSMLSEKMEKNTECDTAKMDEMYAVSRVTACMRRRFFTTLAGRMGLGPRSMRPGDLVVILRGGPTPFILRRQTKDYQILGAAYVHGIMDGEAVKAAQEKGMQEDIFHIR